MLTVGIRPHRLRAPDGDRVANLVRRREVEVAVLVEVGHDDSVWIAADGDEHRRLERAVPARRNATRPVALASVRQRR